MHEEADDKAKKSENGAENLNDEDLNESATQSVSQPHPRNTPAYPGLLQSRVRSISQGRTATIDAYRDTANQVAHAHGNARPEQRIASIVVARGKQVLGVGDGIELRGEDDSHDDAIDGDDFAEDNGDQILGSYPGRLDAAADNGHARCEDAPVSVSLRFQVMPGSIWRNAPRGADDGETDAQADADAGPCVWRDGFKEGADLERDGEWAVLEACAEMCEAAHIECFTLAVE